MKIYKKLNTDFTVTSNEILRHGLSLKAIGLYLYIISKPDGWNFSVMGTASQVTEGKDAIRSGLKELEDAGFLQRKQARSGGKFDSNEWYVADRPLADNPPADKPSAENPTQVSTKEVSNNQVSPTERGDGSPAKGGIQRKSQASAVQLAGSNGQKVSGRKQPSQDITEVVEYLKEKMQLPVLDGSVKQNRYYASNALKKFGGKDRVKMMIDVASQDPFWSTKVTSMMTLFYKGVRIISETRNQKGRTIHVE